MARKTRQIIACGPHIWLVTAISLIAEADRLSKGTLRVHFVFFMRHSRTKVVIVQKFQYEPALRNTPLEQQFVLPVLPNYLHVDMEFIYGASYVFHCNPAQVRFTANLRQF